MYGTTSAPTPCPATTSSRPPPWRPPSTSTRRTSPSPSPPPATGRARHQQPLRLAHLDRRAAAAAAHVEGRRQLRGRPTDLARVRGGGGAVRRARGAHACAARRHGPPHRRAARRILPQGRCRGGCRRRGARLRGEEVRNGGRPSSSILLLGTSLPASLPDLRLGSCLSPHSRAPGVRRTRAQAARTNRSALRTPQPHTRRHAGCGLKRGGLGIAWLHCTTRSHSCRAR